MCVGEGHSANVCVVPWEQRAKVIKEMNCKKGELPLLIAYWCLLSDDGNTSSPQSPHLLSIKIGTEECPDDGKSFWVTQLRDIGGSMAATLTYIRKGTKEEEYTRSLHRAFPQHSQPHTR